MLGLRSSAAYWHSEVNNRLRRGSWRASFRRVSTSVEAEQPHSAASAHLSSSAAAAIVTALGKRKSFSEAREFVKLLHSPDHAFRPDSDYFSAIASIQAEDAASNADSSALFEQIEQLSIGLTDDLISQILKLDTKAGNTQAALSKVSIVLQSYSAAPANARNLSASAFIPLINPIIREKGFSGFQEFTDRFLREGIPLTIRYIGEAIQTFSSISNPLGVNSVWETYVDEDLAGHNNVSSNRVAPDASCARHRLWALGRSFRSAEVDSFFEKWFRSGVFSSDLLSYRTLILLAKSARAFDKVMELRQEMLARGIKPDLRLYNILITAAVEASNVTAMNQLLDDMKNDGVEPDQSTFDSLIMMAAADESSPVTNLVEVMKRAMSSGIFKPGGVAWRRALVRVLSFWDSEKASELIASAVQLNPDSEIDVLDALLTVNLKRYFVDRSMQVPPSSGPVLQELWSSSSPNRHRLSDATIALYLEYLETSGSVDIAEEVAVSIAQNELKTQSLRKTLAAVARIFSHLGKLDQAKDLLHSATQRLSDPLNPDVYALVIYSLQSNRIAALNIFLDYQTRYGWENAATPKVFRAAISVLTRLPQETKASAAAGVDVRATLSEEETSQLAKVIDVAESSILEYASRQTARKVPDRFYRLLIEGFSAVALSNAISLQLRSTAAGKARFWFEESAKAGIAPSPMTVYRLALAFFQVGGAFLPEAERLLRTAERRFKSPTPRLLLQHLLKVKLDAFDKLAASAAQVPDSTPVQMVVTADLNEIVQILRALMRDWEDASQLSTVMARLALEGKYGQQSALQLFYEAIKKYKLTPPPSAFCRALVYIAAVRDASNTTTDSVIVESEDDEGVPVIINLKREEALRLFDLYRRYRPRITTKRTSAASLTLPNAERTPPAAVAATPSVPKDVSFDVKVAHHLIKVMASSGHLSEAYHLIREVAEADSVEGTIASIPLILAYAKGGALTECASIFQRVLDAPDIPHVATLRALRSMLLACSHVDRLDVAWQIFETLRVASADYKTSKNPRLTFREFEVMIFAAVSRDDWESVLKLFDSYREYSNDHVEPSFCLRFVRFFKKLTAVTPQEFGSLILQIEQDMASSQFVSSRTLDKVRVTCGGWVRRVASNEEQAIMDSL